jgi:hypothetical protein
LRFLGNKVPRRIFRPKKELLTAGSTILHNEKLHNFYYLLNIITVIKSRNIRWAWRIARMEYITNTNVVGEPDARDHLQDLVADGRIILKFTLKKQGVMM